MLYEIRFHGRGGQGAVTAATILVRAGLYEGLKGQAIPLFGAERRGAPVYAFARLADKPIRMHSQIYEPDVVVVLDSRLLEIVDVTQGLKSNGVVVLNSDKKPQEVDLGAGKKIATVNATKIALDLNLIVAGWPVVNTAMLGALAKATGIVSIKSVEKAIRAHWSGQIGELNAKAAVRAYEETEVFER